MNNHIELIRHDGLAPVDYAYAAVIEGQTSSIFTAGACPLDAAGNIVAVGDYAGQAEQVMSNLTAVLDRSGAGLADVFKTTVYVVSANQADLVAVWDVIRASFGDHDPPSTLLGVAALGYRDQLVEVEAVAVTR